MLTQHYCKVPFIRSLLRAIHLYLNTHNLILFFLGADEDLISEQLCKTCKYFNSYSKRLTNLSCIVKTILCKWLSIIRSRYLLSVTDMSICSFIDGTISTFLFVCAAVTDEEKMVSVKEGDSVILKTDAEIRRDDQILWTFGPQETLIAEIKSETREITTLIVLREIQRQTETRQDWITDHHRHHN